MKKVNNNSKQNLNPKTNLCLHYENPSDFLSSHNYFNGQLEARAENNQ
jgi:hypothetical protein